MRIRKPVRVLVVDDSAVMRKLIPQLLHGDPSIEVVGTAMDGLLGLKKIAEMRPDVVTLDLEMPRMDGFQTLHEIVRQYHVPVIVVSSHNEEGAYSAFKALALGAFDFVAKPTDNQPGRLEQIARELSVKIKVAAISGPPKQTYHPLPTAHAVSKSKHTEARPTRTVAVGVSTGGPNALHYIFSQLPSDFAGCLLVVQHMPEGFTQMFARRLDDCSAINVVEARSGDMVAPGRAFICPGNRHLKVRRGPQGDMIVLVDKAPVNGHRPSVDVLFHSVAEEFRKESAAVLMTGMGEDGAQGMRAVQAAGGVTIAQSAETCVVDSMPRAAIDAGYVSRVVALEALPSVLQTLCTNDRPKNQTETAVLETPHGTRK
jgi:two-component system, chemotaxis family, protein-glutamate methylesterase/glutaminase